MLLFPDLLPENQNANEEQVHTQRYGRMIFTILPCLLHFLAPMYIVQYDDGRIIRFSQKRSEILGGWLKPMIAVNESKVDR